MLKIQAPNPPVLPRTKSALASTRAIPHCQHPTFAHPGRNFSTLSIFSGWGIQPLAEVADLLAHALAISLKAIGCRFHQRVFFNYSNSNKGKGSLTSGKEWLCSLASSSPESVSFFWGVTPSNHRTGSRLFWASKNINLKQCDLHSFLECFTSKCFLPLVSLPCHL